MMKRYIPISQPSITQKEIKYVKDAVESTWVSSIGKYINRFEEEFAAFCGSKYAISVANGTVAIHLALKAMGIGEGDEVIIPDFSFIATANAVLYANAKPVFVDIDPYNLCITPSLIQRAITQNTKAIIPVHLYGHPADMEAINIIAKKNNLLVIEDAAEAHGASIDSKKVGNWGDCATFSFYGNKNMTTGEGGMITTDDEALYQKCRFLRDHAMSGTKRYWHTEIGYNYRMTNMQAALGCAQVERVNDLMKRKQEIFECYKANLSLSEDISLNRTYDWAQNAYWLICAEFKGFNIDQRDKLIAELKKKGVDSRPYFYPMSDMPYIDNRGVTTPVTHEVYQMGINLPTYYALSEDDIKFVCQTLEDVFSTRLRHH